jgi:hypothetical protein
MQTTKPPAYLTIAQIGGDPDELLDGYLQSSDTMDGVGRDHSLILHAAARTDTGLLVVNLWPSKDNSEAAARDPRRLGAIQQNGLDPEQMRREHHDVARFVLFA